ncbi:MAG: STAS domain-containing protein [Bacteroidetes bacterium]|nr:STAS domain-containing protein [Bacteroidota bacterium]
MFRAKNIYSSPTTRIIKIEGMVREADIEPWSDLMTELSKSSPTELVLDFSSVGFLDPRAVSVLRQHITERVYLLNCNTLVRNMLQTTGLRRNVLD